MIKVLFISSGNSKDGINPIVVRQGESLISNGINLEYFTIKGKGVLGYISNLYHLKDTINEFNPQILHAHYCSSAYLAILVKGRKILITSLMGDDILGSRKLNGKVTILSSVISKLNNLLSILFFDLSIIKSNQMKLRLWSGNKEVIPNGVDIKKEFYPLDKKSAIDHVGFDSSFVNIIFVTDIKRPEKNYKLAEKAVGFLRSKGYKIYIHQVYSKTTKMLNQYYNAADLLILTSFHEGSPNVIKEAMACNTPIVSTDVGDVKWVFGETEGCYLTTYEAKDVVEKIELAIKFSCEIGRTQGRKRLISLGLDSESIAKRIINIYKSKLKK